MARQLKVKEIAERAGVSAGTVDRVLHNRGKVSEEKRIAVERVLGEIKYKTNIHSSAISLRKGYRLVVCTPTALKGEYWGAVKRGIEQAVDEYSDIDIHCTWISYDQFDIQSCLKAFAQLDELDPDCILIGPTFEKETQELCARLDARAIPYVFVDAMIEGTRPVAVFSCDQKRSGNLIGALMSHFILQEGKVVVFNIDRKGNAHSQNTRERIMGVDEYFRFRGMESKLIKSSFSVDDMEGNRKRMVSLLAEHPDIKGALVMNSRGHIIAELLDSLGRGDIKLSCFDLTDKNIEYLKTWKIGALICQRPELQGFKALQAAISYLIYKKRDNDVIKYMPIDIIVPFNLPYYKDNIQNL